MMLRTTIALPVIAVALACSSSTVEITSAPGPDASTPVAPVVEAGSDAPTSVPDASAPAVCEGACKTTSLVVKIGGQMRTLDRAQFGTQVGSGGVPQLHVEAHSGGAPECPSQMSPTPKYTLNVSSVPRAAAGGKASKADGVTSAFFDFEGDLGLPPLTKATSVSITGLVGDTATPPTWSAFDVTATFAEGTVSGHVYAAYCASLSE